MLEGYPPLVQSIMGTAFTWGMTAAGSSLVFLLQGQGGKDQRKILDGSLGFAAGVMLAASYWSLLAPAIEMADISGLYGSFSFLPVSFGFAVGAFFVYMADLLLPLIGVHSKDWASTIHALERNSSTTTTTTSASQKSVSRRQKQDSISDAEEGDFFEEEISKKDRTDLRYRNPGGGGEGSVSAQPRGKSTSKETADAASWRRILLLIIAITVHNIPEGLAVGVAFGAIGKSASATFDSARNLAVGIGIQNFPEGLAVSLPLRAAGMDSWRSFWYGQLSGMVEPISGLFGTAAVVLAEPLLPYALAFAAGAMVFVVVDDIIPEAYSCGNGRFASFGVIIGFIVMMSLDVGLG